MIRKFIMHLYSKYCEKDVEGYIAQLEAGLKHSDTRNRELQAKVSALATEIRMIKSMEDAGTVCPFASVILKTFADSEGEDANS